MFDMFVGKRVVVIYLEGGVEKTTIGKLQKQDEVFIFLIDDYKNEFLIRKDTINKLKVKGGDQQ